MLTKDTLVLITPHGDGHFSCWAANIPMDDPELLHLLEKYEAAGYSVTGDYYDVQEMVAQITPDLPVTCDFCGHTGSWDSRDDEHGELWGCGECGKVFCSKCLTDRVGHEGYRAIMYGPGNFLCPDCATNNN